MNRRGMTTSALSFADLSDNDLARLFRLALSWVGTESPVEPTDRLQPISCSSTVFSSQLPTYGE
jgi:hypothetical protein